MPKLNVKNRTLFIHDNLDILNNINSETVDLIYLDPPFNSNRHYAAPIGSKAAGASFKDAWTLDDIDLAWVGQIDEKYPALSAVINTVGMIGSAQKSKSNKAYLVFMARRLLEMRRILKPTGTLYLHCDPVMSHSLKMAMDTIFGAKNFMETIWAYGTPSGGRTAGKRPVKGYDTLLCYAVNYGDHTYNRQYLPYDENYLKWFHNQDNRGRLYRTRTRGEKVVRQYLDQSLGIPMSNVWSDIRQLYAHGWFRPHREKTGYPTQKPLALLERIIATSSNKGDLVFDPFCGCATTMVAAEMHDRQWLGIDVSDKAVELIKSRLESDENLYESAKRVIVRRDCPARTDNGQLMVNPKQYKHTLYGVQEGICAGCKIHFPFSNLTVDHIVPHAKGGQNIEENLQLLCGSCNSIKGDREMAYLLVELKKRGVLPTLTTTQKRRKQS